MPQDHQNAVVFGIICPAFIVSARGRIGANHKKTFRTHAFMPSAGGKDRDVARSELQCAPAGATEQDADFSARDAQHFMDARMVVHKVVNPCAP